MPEPKMDPPFNAAPIEPTEWPIGQPPPDGPCQPCLHGDHDDCDNGYPLDLRFAPCYCEVCRSEH